METLNNLLNDFTYTVEFDHKSIGYYIDESNDRIVPKYIPKYKLIYNDNSIYVDDTKVQFKSLTPLSPNEIVEMFKGTNGTIISIKGEFRTDK